jgi:Spy/CpxP family protein refolding chaperone
MSKSYAGLLLGLLIVLPATGAEPTAAKPPAAKPATASTAAADQRAADTKALEEFRNDLQAVETEVISKAISLTAAEATKFWPLFERFQKEQKVIIDGQIEAVRKYAENYATLTDADAAAYVSALLDRDKRINELRTRYMAEFAKVLPAGKAARVVHVSRRLALVAQAKLSTEVPLVR